MVATEILCCLMNQQVVKRTVDSFLSEEVEEFAKKIREEPDQQDTKSDGDVSSTGMKKGDKNKKGD